MKLKYFSIFPSGEYRITVVSFDNSDKNISHLTVIQNSYKSKN